MVIPMESLSSFITQRLVLVSDSVLKEPIKGQK